MTPIERVLNSRLASDVVRAAGAAASSAILRPEVPVDNSKAAAVGHAARQEMIAKIASSPELQHVTNAEPWFRKRSRWAAIVSLVFPIIVPLGAKYGLDLDSKTQEQIIEVCVTVGGFVAAWLAYRAGTATKPLGA